MGCGGVARTKGSGADLLAQSVLAADTEVKLVRRRICHVFGGQQLREVWGKRIVSKRGKKEGFKREWGGGGGVALISRVCNVAHG